VHVKDYKTAKITFYQYEIPTLPLYVARKLYWACSECMQRYILITPMHWRCFIHYTFIGRSNWLI